MQPTPSHPDSSSKQMSWTQKLVQSFKSVSRVGSRASVNTAEGGVDKSESHSPNADYNNNSNAGWFQQKGLRTLSILLGEEEAKVVSSKVGKEKSVERVGSRTLGSTGGSFKSRETTSGGVNNSSANQRSIRKSNENSMKNTSSNKSRKKSPGQEINDSVIPNKSPSKNLEPSRTLSINALGRISGLESTNFGAQRSYFGGEKSGVHKNLVMDVLTQGLVGNTEIVYKGNDKSKNLTIVDLSDDDEVSNSESGPSNKESSGKTGSKNDYGMSEADAEFNKARRRARLMKRRVLDLAVLIKHGSIVWAARKRREMETVAEKLDEADEEIRKMAAANSDDEEVVDADPKSDLLEGGAPGTKYQDLKEIDSGCDSNESYTLDPNRVSNSAGTTDIPKKIMDVTGPATILSDEPDTITTGNNQNLSQTKNDTAVSKEFSKEDGIYSNKSQGTSKRNGSNKESSEKFHRNLVSSLKIESSKKDAVTIDSNSARKSTNFQAVASRKTLNVAAVRNNQLEDIHDIMGFNNTKSMALGTASMRVTRVPTVTTGGAAGRLTLPQNDEQQPQDGAGAFFGTLVSYYVKGSSGGEGTKNVNNSGGAHRTVQHQFTSQISHLGPRITRNSRSSAKVVAHDSSDHQKKNFFGGGGEEKLTEESTEIQLTHISRHQFMSNIRGVSFCLFWTCLVVSGGIAVLLSKLLVNTTADVCPGDNGGRNKIGLDASWLEDLRKELWRRTGSKEKMSEMGISKGGREESVEKSFDYWDKWVRDSEKKWEKWDEKNSVVELARKWASGSYSSNYTEILTTATQPWPILDTGSLSITNPNTDVPFPNDPVIHFLHYHTDKTSWIPGEQFDLRTRYASTRKDWMKILAKNNGNDGPKRHLLNLGSRNTLQWTCSKLSNQLNELGNLKAILWGLGSAEYAIPVWGVWLKIFFNAIVERMGFFLWASTFWYIGLIDPRRQAEEKWLNEIDLTWWKPGGMVKKAHGNWMSSSDEPDHGASKLAKAREKDRKLFFRIVYLGLVLLVIGSFSPEYNLREYIIENYGTEEAEKVHYNILFRFIGNMCGIFAFNFPFIFLFSRFRAEFFAQLGFHFTNPFRTNSTGKFNPLTRTRIGYPEAIDIEDTHGRPWFRIIPMLVLFYEYLVQWSLPGSWKKKITPPNWTELAFYVIVLSGAYLAAKERELLRKKERRHLRELGLMGGGVIVDSPENNTSKGTTSSMSFPMKIPKILSTNDSLSLRGFVKSKGSKKMKTKTGSHDETSERNPSSRDSLPEVPALVGNMSSLFWLCFLLWMFQLGEPISFYINELAPSDSSMGAIDRLVFWHCYTIFVLCFATAFGQCLFLRYRQVSVSVLFVWPFHLFFSVGGTFQIFRLNPKESEYWLGVALILSIETYRDSGFWVHVNRAWWLYTAGKRKIKKMSKEFLVRRRSSISSNTARMFQKNSQGMEGNLAHLADVPSEEENESKENPGNLAKLKNKVVNSVAKVIPKSLRSKDSLNVSDDDIYENPDYDPFFDDRDPFSDLAEIFYWNIQSGLAEKAAQVLVFLFAIAELIMSSILGDNYVPYLLPTKYIDTLDGNSPDFDPQTRLERARNFPWEDYENNQRVKMEYYSQSVKNSFNGILSEDGKTLAINDLAKATNFYDISHPLAASPFFTDPTRYGHNENPLRQPLSNPPRHVLKDPGDLMLHFLGLFLIYIFEALQCRFCEEWNKGMLMHGIKMEEKAFERGNKKLVKKTRRVYEDFETDVSAMNLKLNIKSGGDKVVENDSKVMVGSNADGVNNSHERSSKSLFEDEDNRSDLGENLLDEKGKFKLTEEEESVIKAALVEAVRQHFQEYKIFMLVTTLYASYLIFLYGPMLWGWKLTTFLPYPAY